jgi:hypothetical protein
MQALLPLGRLHIGAAGVAAGRHPRPRFMIFGIAILTVCVTLLSEIPCATSHIHVISFVTNHVKARHKVNSGKHQEEEHARHDTVQI